VSARAGGRTAPGAGDVVLRWLRTLWVLFVRELRSIFLTVLAYAVLSLSLFANGGVFLVYITVLADQHGGINMPPMEMFFGQTIFFYIIMLVGPPIVTMRSIASEWKTGTIEAVLTAPVTETQLVLSKFLAYWCFFIALWIPTVSYPLLLEWYGSLDWGPVASGYLGTLLLGGLLVSLGILTSALTKHQLLAGLLSFSFGFTLFVVGILAYLSISAKATPFFEFINMWGHMEEFAQGTVDTRRVIYYLTSIAAVLAVTIKAVQLKRVGQ
jgi:ABC-2 type transport system permease protein